MTGTTRAPLRWEPLERPDGVRIEQALARNNSWYLVPSGDAYEVRYASQAANSLIVMARSIDEAKRAADEHADRYDTRADA